MKEQITYWFVRVKEVGHANEYGEQVEDRMFYLTNSGNREKAKQYCIDKYGKLPFRKPKNAPNGTRYFYLMASDKYWYDMHLKEHEVICAYCNKSYIQIGSTIKSKKYDVWGKSICSLDCQISYLEKRENEYNTMENENYFVDEHSHPLTNKNKELVGYIYKITNKRLMNSYVGKTIKPPIFRWWQHLKVEDKFEREDLSDLVFEVIEIVYFDKDKPTDILKYKDGDDKLSKRESYYIEYYDTVNNGFNKVK